MPSKFQDWSKKSINFQSGCENDCLYCYAKGMARKFKWPIAKHWHKPEIRQKDVDKKQRLYKDQPVMFPSSHDLTLENQYDGYKVLYKLLLAGNQVIIVTKPKYVVIKEICEQFNDFKGQFIFRFTITSLYDSDLKLWEPKAPRFQERFNSLRYAFNRKFKTSISAEPIINADCVPDLFKTLEPAITDKFWLGKMNHKIIVKDPPVSDQQLLDLYNMFKDEPKVCWKTETLDYIEKIS